MEYKVRVTDAVSNMVKARRELWDRMENLASLTPEQIHKMGDSARDKYVDDISRLTATYHNAVGEIDSATDQAFGIYSPKNPKRDNKTLASIKKICGKLRKSYGFDESTYERLPFTMEDGLAVDTHYAGKQTKMQPQSYSFARKLLNLPGYLMAAMTPRGSQKRGARHNVSLKESQYGHSNLPSEKQASYLAQSKFLRNIAKEAMKEMRACIRYENDLLKKLQVSADYKLPKPY